MPFTFAVEHNLSGGIMAGFFISQEGHQTFLQSAKAAFDLAFGLRGGGDQMRDSEGGEGALELRTGIPVIAMESWPKRLRPSVYTTKGGACWRKSRRKFSK